MQPAAGALNRPMGGYRETLRRMTIRDDGLAADAASSGTRGLAASGLDAKTHALVRIATLAAVDAAPQCYGPWVDAAHQGGASDEEIVGALIAAIPSVGYPRIVSAAPKLALALGYDLEDALEDDRTESDGDADLPAAR